MRYLLVLMFCFVTGNRLFAQTENEIYCYMVSIGIKHPDIVLKQAIYETGHFKSNIFCGKNNLFGFRHNKYVCYDSWKACVDYYKVWQDKHYTNDSLDYYIFLASNNFSGKNRQHYVSQIKNTRIKATLNCDVDEKIKQ
jgi:hypothetical protein